MSYRKSIFIGIGLVSVVIMISIVTFLKSRGSCISGTFECGHDDNQKCVPQHMICSRSDTCRKDYAALCGLHYGSTYYMESIVNTSVPKNVHFCTLRWSPNYCICVVGTGLLCGASNLSKIPSLPPEVTFLYLEGNNIQLNDDSLNGLNLTHKLDLGENNISTLPMRVFHSQKWLEQLFLRRNQIKIIPQTAFQGLTKLKWLFMQENLLNSFPLNELRELISLEWLNLSKNQLTLNGENFPELPNITEINLSNNLIERIDVNMFPKLMKLHFLSLSNNNIFSIHPAALDGLVNLRELRLAHNKLTHISSKIFSSLQSLDALFIGYNKLKIQNDMLQFANISLLNLEGIEYGFIDFTAIERAQSIKAIFYHRFHYCSMTPNIKNCKPNSDGISSGNNLLSKTALRYSAWTMATITCVGNSLVLWGRFMQRDENRAVSMVIRNLAISDFLMGLYLAIIGIQDYRYRNKYSITALEWIASWECIAVGVVAMISSEVSLLILTFISIERFLLIADPFGGHRKLTTQNVFLCLFTIWLIGISISIIPVIFWRKSTSYYGMYSGTCFPLHLQERYFIGWQYSAIVFIGINLMLLILIAILYTALLISIWKTRKQTPLGVFDCEFAIRFFFIVLVDTSCWAPIIATKAITFFSYEISADVYAFLVVFVLPLNSAVNPILYTFTTPKYRNQVLLRGWNKLTSRRPLKHEGSGHTGSGHTGSNSNQITGRSNMNLSRNKRIQLDDERCS